MKRFFEKIPSGSVVLMITSFLSYALGLLRDHFFATTFGASRMLDAYNAAFIFPDLIFNILIAGTIAAAFIPIFTGLYQKNKIEAQNYCNSILTASTSTMILSAVIIFFFANSFTPLVAPGFSQQDQTLVAKLMRILAISPIFFAASNALGGLLMGRQKFLFYGLSPVFYNLGIILGTIFLSPYFGILGVAYGTVGGAMLHLLCRIWDARSLGFHFKPAYDFQTPWFKKTLRLMLPKMLGHPVELLTFWGFTAIASTLPQGSIATLNFARNFQSVPISLIGITIATTTFPILSKASNEREIAKFWKIFQNSFFLILGLTIFSAIFIFTIRFFLIGLFLGGGQFTSQDIIATGTVLGVFCLSIPTESLVHLLARAFYATKNTTIPVAFSIGGFLISIGGGYLLTLKFGILALPFSFFLASGIEVVFLFWLLPKRLKKIDP